MKKILLSSLFAFLLTFDCFAFEPKPFFGLDYIISKVDTSQHKQLHKTIFPQKYTTLEAVGGIKLSQVFGVEAFFQQSVKRKKRSVIEGNSIEAKLSYRAFGADLIGYLPVSQHFDLLGSLGFGFYDIHQKISASEAGESKNYVSHWAPRIGFGTEFYFNEYFSVRFMGRYAHLDQKEKYYKLKYIADLSLGVRYYY